MEIIDGKKISKEYLKDLKERVAKLSFTPVFCDVIVGDDPVSLQYIGMKEKRAEKCGIAVNRVAVPGDATTEEVIARLQEALQNPDVCGVIVQLPLPDHIDQKRVLDTVPSEVDVDVLSQTSSDKFYNNESKLTFPTARAVYELLQTVPHDKSTAHVVVIGRGILVGKPIAHILEREGYTFEVASRENPLTPEMLGKADVILSAAGSAHLVTGEHLKPGVIIIDAGTSESNGGVVGDVDKDSVAEKAGYLAPVPGGVGPMTVAILLANVVEVAEVRDAQ
jgi:methylenetetrahydrofolate dehydrogenase (NADP+)/methenyltetrahydrofolate cyclohydrolase